MTEINHTARAEFRRFRLLATLVGVALVVGAVVPWPSVWQSALREPADRLRILLGGSAIVLVGLAWAGPWMAAMLQWIDCRCPRWWLGLLAGALVVAAAIPRLYWPASLARLGAPDSIEYALGARNLLYEGRYVIRVGGAEHPPRYPFGYSAFFVAPILAVVGAEPHNAVYAGFVASVAAMVLLWWLAQRHLGSVAAVGGVSLAIFSPLLFTYTTNIFADPAVLLVFLVVLSLTLGLRFTPVRVLALGLLIGLSTAVKLSLGLLGALPLLKILCGRGPWRQRGALMAALLGGMFAGIVPLLIFNAQQFANPLRTGYHYWCSIPYDFPRLTFSITYLFESASGSGPGNLVAYLLPHGAVAGVRSPERWIEIAFCGLILIGAVASLRPVSSAHDRRYVLWVTVAAGLYLAFFGFYFFQDVRFLLPVYVGLMPLAAAGVERLLAVPESLHNSRAFSVLLLMAVCAGAWWLGPRWSRPADSRLREMSSARQELARTADHLLPIDARIISNLDGAFVEHFLLKDTGREYLPLDRGVEYASKYVQPRAPRGAEMEAVLKDLPADDPFAHRAILLPGAAEVYPKTALEVLDEIAVRAEQGDRYYLVIEMPFDEAGLSVLNDRLRAISEHFSLQSLQRGVGIWQMLPR